MSKRDHPSKKAFKPPSDAAPLEDSHVAMIGDDERKADGIHKLYPATRLEEAASSGPDSEVAPLSHESVVSREHLKLVEHLTGPLPENGLPLSHQQTKSQMRTQECHDGVPRRGFANENPQRTSTGFSREHQKVVEFITRSEYENHTPSINEFLTGNEMEESPDTPRIEQSESRSPQTQAESSHRAPNMTASRRPTRPGAFRVRGYAAPTASDDDDIHSSASNSLDGFDVEEPVLLSAEKVNEHFEELRSLELERLRREVSTFSSVGRVVTVQGSEMDVEAEEKAKLKNRRARWIGSMAVSCLVLVGVVMIAVFASRGSDAGEVDGITEAPSDVPSMTPTDSSDCFNSKSALLEAVDQYIADNSETSAVALERGWPIGSWCVGRIQDFSEVFARSRNRQNAAFNDDISSWDVSQGTDFTRCFEGTRALNTQLASWDMSSATSLQQMFQDSSYNQPLELWNVSRVRSFDTMFFNATSFSQDLTGWDMSGATSLKQMFQQANSFNADISTWDVSSVVNLEQLFLGATEFNGDISSWNVSRVTDMSSILEVALTFRTDISNWDVSQVTSLRSAFEDATVFNSDINGWDVSKVVDMTNAFQGATGFNRDLSSWNVSAVESFRAMLSDASLFNQDLSSWDLSSATDLSSMFLRASAFTQDMCSWTQFLESASSTNMFSQTSCPVQEVDTNDEASLCFRC